MQSLKLSSVPRRAVFLLETDDQLDLQALHRVRSRLISDRAPAVIKQAALSERFFNLCVQATHYPLALHPPPR